jgi:UDP-GlcNAc:undecaprenyl-phosphate/decaprenyl-phosphate GlcNAc-1-phosphate transferase
MPEITVTGIPAILLAFFTSLVITWYFVPRIIRVVNERNLVNRPVEHNIHEGNIPRLGGIAIFAGFTTGLLLSVNGYIHGITYITVSCLLIFFVGLIDDLLFLKPKNKLASEILIVFVIVLFTDLRFTDLHGFLGISVIPAWVSYLLSVFLIVIIMNAFNLIDGIDGLASSVGVISALAFGIWFYLSGDWGYTIMSVSLTGALLAFLRFNLSSGKDKIFMGDSGSLVIGLVLAIFAVHFSQLNLTDKAAYKLYSSPSVSIAILIIPLFDTLRVIVLRIRDHQHPFIADNRHVHHMMLRAGFSHKKATVVISIFNIFLIALALLLDPIGILYLGLVLLILCMLFIWVIMRIVRKKEIQRPMP